MLIKGCPKHNGAFIVHGTVEGKYIAVEFACSECGQVLMPLYPSNTQELEKENNQLKEKLKATGLKNVHDDKSRENMLVLLFFGNGTIAKGYWRTVERKELTSMPEEVWICVDNDGQISPMFTAPLFWMLLPI